MTNFEIGFLCGRLYELFRLSVCEKLHRETLTVITAYQEYSFILSDSDTKSIAECLTNFIPYLKVMFITVNNSSTKVILSANREDLIRTKLGGLC